MSKRFDKLVYMFIEIRVESYDFAILRL